jgi:hypothetical protein
MMVDGCGDGAETKMVEAMTRMCTS